MKPSVCYFCGKLLEPPTPEDIDRMQAEYNLLGGEGDVMDARQDGDGFSCCDDCWKEQGFEDLIEDDNVEELVKAIKEDAYDR